jgi:S1-C subfamily serine protease
VSTSTVNALSDVIANHKPGDTIRLVVYRANAKQTIEVKLGRQRTSP